MVLESFVVHLLDKYLGDYIENLDSDKLKIDLWHGDVVLENLYLKSNALANFNLPVTVTTGYLQKLLLHISWKHLYKHPIKITIDGFYLLLAPNTEVEYDAERDEKEQYEAKMKEVHKVEEFRKETETYENAKTPPKHKDTFLERIQFHIIRNLELSISNIHIAYEDKITKPGHPFAFGITLNYVKLHTTNTEWEHVTSPEDSPVMYKLGELNTLSIYWNSNVKPRSELSKENIVDDLHAKIVKNDQTVPEYMNYILRPLNVKAELKIATKPHEQDFVSPIFDGKIDLDEVNLNINRNQYSDLLDLLELYEYLNLKSKYIKYYAMMENDDIDKPSLRRWKFAYAAIMNEKVRPRLASYKWENIRDNLNQCREYHTLHCNELIGKVTKEQKERAHELETKIDVFNLIYVRRTAEIEVKTKKAEHKETSWWDHLSSWWSSNSDNKNPELDLENEMTIEEKKKLFDGIVDEDDQTSLLYPEEYVDIDLSIRLNILEVNVWSNINDNDSQFKVIARVALSDTEFIFQRRPATSDFVFIVDLDSIHMYGVVTDTNQTEILNNNDPVLVQPANRSKSQHEKFLHVEFETNPLGNKSDYRLQVISQSLEIIYNALTINKLVECFLPDRHHDLKGVKETAYSLYTDIKHRTQFLLSYKLRKIKALDIDIDLQSFYFLLPENGVYQNGCSTICLDFGHLAIQGSQNHHDNKNIDDTHDISYIPLKLQLENIQLLYTNQNEDWRNNRTGQDSSMHLIKPITISVDVYKCIYPDDDVLPLWKLDARASAIDIRLSDTRLFGFIKLYQSIPFPATNESPVETQIGSKPPILDTVVPRKNTKKTFEAIESMTPVKKILQETDNAQEQESTDEQVKEVVDSQEQLTELEANLELPRIELLIEESLSDSSDSTQPLVRISFIAITARATITTFDIEFDASLADLIILHEQFLTNSNEPLRLLSTACDDKLLNVKCLLSSPENPLFYSAPYNGIENKVQMHINKLVMMLQVEALVSIFRFQNDLMEKLPKQQDNKETQERTAPKPNSSSEAQKKSLSVMSTFQIEGDLEEFRVIVGTEFSQILDIQLQGLTVNALQAAEKSAVYLMLNDFHILDPHANTRYRKIIVQQGHEKQILCVDVSRFNHSKIREKTLDEVDCDIKIYFAKMNVVFLYKHLDLIMNVLNTFKTNKTKKADVSSNNASDTVQQFQEQALKCRFDISLNAPTILFPVNSHSNEAIFIDLGQLTLKTHFLDDANRSLVEQQALIFKNLLASRVKLNNNNEILGDIILLECAEFHTWIDRLLRPRKIKHESEISVKVEWESIDFTISKGDYSCMMKIVKENFSEKIFHKIPQSAAQEQSEDGQTNRDNVLPDVAVKKQKDSSDNKISEKIRLNFEIKKIALTLYLGESNLTVHRAPRNESSQFVTMRVEMFEAYFRQLSDSSYDATVQVQTFLLDDLRETNPSDSVTRLMDRNFNVDPNAQIFIATLQFKPKTETETTDLRQVDAQLESLYICVSPNNLMALKDFFKSELSSDDETKSDSSILQTPPDVQCDLLPPAKCISTHPRPSDEFVSLSPSSRRTTMAQSGSPQVSSDVETRIEFIIKTPQIVLLEDQSNANSNCLVLDLVFQMHMVIVGESTKLSGSFNKLSIYDSNFAELKDSKIKYQILQPTDIDIVLNMNSEHQKIDLRIGDISVIIAPALIQTIASVMNSIGKLQTTSPDEKEKINSKSLFDPKPFKEELFWFTQNTEKKQKITEQTDTLEVATGTPSHKKAVIEEKNKQEEKEEKSQTQKPRSQQLTFNLKLIEAKLELRSGSTTKSVIVICLSDLFVDAKNWSNDMSLFSRIQIELALFNDHILAWEPLIEPIIDERGEVISPWCITCSTTTEEEDDNANEYLADRRDKKRSKKSRFLINHRKSSFNTEEQHKDSAISLNARNRIQVRAEHLLNVTVTKTSVDLAQRLLKMFNDTCTKQLTAHDDDDKAMLSVHNMTGYEILIDNITGVEFVEDNISETSVNLKHEESVPLTIPGEQLSATHFPAITEQATKRRQEFSVKIDNKVITVDINQTCERVYELGPSSIPNWPIQMLCDSQIYNDRRRVILSSIVKIYNRTLMPLVILDVDSIEMRKYHQVARLEVNGDYYLPIRLLYMRSSTRLFIGIDEGDSTEHINDFISFDWRTESTIDRILKMKNGKEAHFVIYEESTKAYCENTDEPIRTCFHIHIKLALHLINLLPIDIQCSIDSDEQIDLKPSELYHSTSGNKQSVLIFTVPSYNNAKWISKPVDLKVKGHGHYNEHIVQLYDANTRDTLRMILRVTKFRETYRASLYSPFWVLNCTDLKFEFKIESEKTLIDIGDSPFLVCPKKFDSEAHKKKGHIRLYSIEQDDTVSQWSEGFSLHVIKSTGITSCKVFHDRTYMVCVSIVTCSFGMSKIITLTPSMAIINNSSVEIEVVETVSGIEQDIWKSMKPVEIIPFWPRDIKEGVMCVRYAHNRASSSTFAMNDKHRTLLRMNDEERPALHVEVIATDFLGIHIVFGDYKIGDAPVLLVNCLRNQAVTFCQEQNIQTQLLPPQYYVYYTWIDSLKPQKLVVSCNSQSATVELNPLCGILETDDQKRVHYAVFHDGLQTVLIFAEETSIIRAVSYMPSLGEFMNQYIQISIREIGISIINDITREDLFYITINKSKDIWTETHKSLVRPLSHELNHHLEKHYKTHHKHRKANAKDKGRGQVKYHIDKNRDVAFNDDNAELIENNGDRVRIRRQALDGLWIAFAWSVSNAVLHVRINHVQIDDQLEYTMFPVVLHPVVSKAAGTNISGKPFIELSVFKTNLARSKTVHFKYFKLLIQEFVFCADQGLIESIFTFFKSEKNLPAPKINMDADLKRIEEPLQTIVKAQVDNPSEETHIYFDNIHLSPLKIHVSFSMHGSKPNEQLLAEYPLADFLLQLLNVAEVEDVILKLNFYDRKNHRFTIIKLTTEITTHYEHQLLKQIHVLVLGLDVLGNPFGVIRGVADGVESFFYEPYKGAIEGPIECIEGIASGTEHLVGSAVGGAAGAVSKITGVISKSLATLTFDEDYQSVRIQRKELMTPKKSDVVESGKHVVKDVVHGVKGVVKKPVEGAKKRGAPGFVKGLGKGFLGLVARPTSSVAEFTSTSFELIKRTATQEEVVHRVRQSRHIGVDGIVRPSTAYETMGFYIFNGLNIEKYTEKDNYVAHINCSESEPGWLLATSKHLMFVTEKSSSSSHYDVEWHFQYKELKEAPVVKFDPNQIEILLKAPKVLGTMKKDRIYEKIIAYQNIGEARYIVDKIILTMHSMEL